MIEKIKEQFHLETLNELQIISTNLSAEIISPEDMSLLINRIFSITHQISGTGPMLGFDYTSKLSRKIEKTFYEIRSGEKALNMQIVLQTRRTIDTMIKSINDEFNSKRII